MIREKDNRDMQDVERWHLAQIEALRRALAERDMLIERLREDVATAESYQRYVSLPPRH